MKNLFLSCKKATELVEKKAAFGLSPIESFQLSMHLRMCDACALYEKYSKQIDKIYQNFFQKQLLDTAHNDLENKGLKERVYHQIDLMTEKK